MIHDSSGLFGLNQLLSEGLSAILSSERNILSVLARLLMLSSNSLQHDSRRGFRSEGAVSSLRTKSNWSRGRPLSLSSFSSTLTMRALQDGSESRP